MEARANGYGYALTTIENPTELTLHYSVQWGDGRWVTYTLYPGEYRTHYYEYGWNDDRHSPQLRIRFDSTLCDDGYVPKVYRLDRYANYSVSHNAGKRYLFRVSPGGCFLDLVGVN
jgi:hypothetical protein